MAYLLAGLAAWLLTLAAWWLRTPGPADGAAPPGPDPHAADLAVFRRQVADYSRG